MWCDTPYHNYGLKLSQFDSDIDSRAKEVYDIRGQYDRLVKFWASFVTVVENGWQQKIYKKSFFFLLENINMGLFLQTEDEVMVFLQKCWWMKQALKLKG